MIIMRKGLEQMKRVCRDNRFTVREYKFDSKAVKNAQAVKDKLALQKKHAWSYMVARCRANFSELYQFWIHLKGIRTFVESVLRFGLPIRLCASCIQLKSPLHQQKVRKILGSLYSNLDQSNLTAALDSSEMDLSGFGADFYPYVYLTINNI